MKFFDDVTKATLETDNEIVIAQYKKHSDRYKVVEEKTTKSKKSK
jgi:hypothetical protein